MTPLACMSGSCAAELPESQATTINLSTDVMPSLSSYTSLVSISISRITYTVRSNTLNVDVPPLSIYLAPERGDRSDGLARGALRHGPRRSRRGARRAGNVQLVPNAASVFQTFTSNLATPFEHHHGRHRGDRRRNPGPDRGDHDRRDRRALRAAVSRPQR